MLIPTLFFFFFAPLICSATATTTAVEGGVQLAWRRKIGSGQSDRISGLRFDSNGHITAALWMQDALNLSHGETNGNAHVAKYDTEGRLVWDVPMEIPFQNVPAIALDNSGNMYVSGSTNDSLWCAAKLNKSGSAEWNTTEDADWVGSPLVAVDTFGNAYYTGIFHDDVLTMGVVKYDSNGTSRWTQAVGDQDCASPVCSVVDSTGNLYVVGNTAIPSPVSTTIGERRWAMVMAKFGPDGDLLASYQGNPLVGDEFARACVLDNTDHLYIAGQSSYFINSKPQQRVNATLVQLNQTGSLQWMRHVAGRLHLQFTGIAVDDQRNLYVAGEALAARSNRIVLMKFASNGAQLWSQVIASHKHDTVTSILVDSTLRRIVLAGLACAPDGSSHSEVFLLQLVESAAEPLRLVSRPAVRSPEDVDGHGRVTGGLLVGFVVFACWAVLNSLFGANWLRQGSACETINAVCDVVNEQKVLAATHGGRDSVFADRRQGDVESAVGRHESRAFAIV